MPLFSVAAYNLMGIVTKPKVIALLQIALSAILFSSWNFGEPLTVPEK
jgi:hypothetical protein